MCPKMGRPPTENPKSDRFNIRVSPSEKAEILKFSKDTDIGLLELLRIGIQAVKEKKE